MKKKVKKLIEKNIDSTKDTKKLEQIKELIKRYNKLDKDLQNHIMEEVISLIDQNIQKEEQVKAKRKCNEKGHKFNEWIEKSYSREGFDLPECDLQETEIHYFVRICKRCGLMESQHELPNELKKNNKK